MSKKCVNPPTVTTVRPRSHIYRSRIIFLATCTILAIFFYWMQLIYLYRPFVATERNDLIDKDHSTTKDIEFELPNVDINRNLVPDDLQPLLFDADRNDVSPESREVSLEEIENSKIDMHKNTLPEDLKHILYPAERNDMIPNLPDISIKDLDYSKDSEVLKRILYPVDRNDLPPHFPENSIENIDELKVNNNDLPEDLKRILYSGERNYLKPDLPENSEKDINNPKADESENLKQVLMAIEKDDNIISDSAEVADESDDDVEEEDLDKNKPPEDLEYILFTTLRDNSVEKHSIPLLPPPPPPPEPLEITTKDSYLTNQKIDDYEDEILDNMKYVLLWTQYEHAPFYFFEEGQRTFIKHNCSEINCYVTKNRTYFGNDLTKFDAIAFNGRTMSVNSLPETRAPHQRYIFFNMESAVNFPVCDEKFDGFFNLTATYKLDSDIPYPYIAIRNRNGDIIGPRENMRWPRRYPRVDEELAATLANKSKAAAWFVSHCNSKSGRDQLVKKLQEALKPYGHTIDVYGRCGSLQCPRNETKKCNYLLEKDYFFYMSLENSFADDYVTEKLLTALQHDTVPIVYGGADYSRFLPPGSYIDSEKFDVEQLAATMDRLMRTPEMYKRFFRWKSLYTYIDPTRKENVCDVCAAMHRNEKTKPEYDHFRKWWNPNYDRTDCKM